MLRWHPIYFTEEDIIDNDAFLNQRFANNRKGRASYVVSFRDMARQGFVSMDRTSLTEPRDNHYHIVCRPRLLREKRLKNIGIPVMPIGEKPEFDFSPLGLLE